MATRKDHIAFLEDCLKHIPEIRFKAMFGGHALYCSERVVGLVGDPRVRRSGDRRRDFNVPMAAIAKRHKRLDKLNRHRRDDRDIHPFDDHTRHNLFQCNHQFDRQ